MARKRFTPEQIIGKLREAEGLLAQGEKMGVPSVPTYLRHLPNR